MRIAAFFLLGVLAWANAQAQIVATLGAPARGGDIAVNPATNRIYVVDSSNAVVVIDGATNATLQVPVGRDPRYVAVNVSTNRIYVSNSGDGTLSVIDGATNAVANLPIGGSGPIAVNERTNRIYVIREGNAGEVAVIDGVANTWYTMKTGSQMPRGLVVNPDTNRLYVTHGAGDVRVIDASSTSDQPPSISVPVMGFPSLVALDRATNRIYVSAGDTRDPIVEIDGATNAATAITMPGHAPYAVDLVVNPATHRVYLSLQSEIAVVDGATRAVSYIPTGPVGRLAVDPGQDRVYGPDVGTLLVIDGATQSFARLAVSTAISSVAVNPATHRIYASGVGTVVLDGNAIATPPPNYGVNVQGMWWNEPAGSESGWGLYVAHQGYTLFAVWYTYDTDGNPMWLVAPNVTRYTDRSYRGDIFRVSGPGYAANFDPANVHATVVGNITIGLEGTRDNLLFMSGTVLGTYVSKWMTRHLYSAPVPTCTAGGPPGAIPNYQDMWWLPSESGWGLSIAHQGDVIFAVLYLYDDFGKAAWAVAPNVPRTGNATFSGALYRTRGPAYNAPWRNSDVSVGPLGTLSLSFSDADNGVLTYTYAGITRSKPITRQAFATPRSVCR